MPPRKSSIESVPTRKSSRRSGDVSEFLSLDLYSGGRIEKNLRSFKPGENHNGVKAEPVTPKPPVLTSSVNKRRGKPSDAASSKRQKRDSSVETNGKPPSVAAQPKKRGRPGNPAKPRTKSAAKLFVKDEPDWSGDEDEDDNRTLASIARSERHKSAIPAPLPVDSREQTITVKSVLDQDIRQKFPTLNASNRNEVSSLLQELCDTATDMIAAAHGNTLHNLRTAVHFITTGQRAPDTQFVVKMNSLAEDHKELKVQVQALKAEKKELISALIDSEKNLDKINEEKLKMQQQLNMMAMTSASSASTDSAASTRRTRQNQPLMPQPPQPGFNVKELPKGSAVGQTTMSGRAGEIIEGLANVAGMENTMASVAVMAATMPDIDADGNEVQRTIRTRVERIAVTDDMNLAELQRLGFEVVHVEGSDDDDDDEDGEGNAEIEEMEDDNEDMDSGEEEGGLPYVEEAE